MSEAIAHRIFSVCVTSQRLEYVKEQLRGSPVKIVMLLVFLTVMLQVMSRF